MRKTSRRSTRIIPARSIDRAFFLRSGPHAARRRHPCPRGFVRPIAVTSMFGRPAPPIADARTWRRWTNLSPRVVSSHRPTDDFSRPIRRRAPLPWSFYGRGLDEGGANAYTNAYAYAKGVGISVSTPLRQRPLSMRPPPLRKSSPQTARANAAENREHPPNVPFRPLPAGSWQFRGGGGRPGDVPPKPTARKKSRPIHEDRPAEPTVRRKAAFVLPPFPGHSTIRVVFSSSVAPFFSCDLPRTKNHREFSLAPAGEVIPARRLPNP